MGAKNWRITSEQEFYEKACKYIDEHVKKFSENLSESGFEKRKISSIKTKISVYNNYPENASNREKIMLGLKVVLEDVNDWRSFSSNVNSSLEDIVLRQLISRIFNCNYVCSLLISKNLNITEDFINDYIYISSPLFRFEEWDDAHVKAVSDCAASGQIANKDKKLIELYGKTRLNCRPINIKIDLTEINTEGKSKEFIDKYYKRSSNGKLYPISSMNKASTSNCRRPKLLK